MNIRDEVIVRKIKNGKGPKTKILIIIIKEGKEDEIEEEIPLEKAEETYLNKKM